MLDVTVGQRRVMRTMADKSAPTDGRVILLNAIIGEVHDTSAPANVCIAIATYTLVSTVMIM